MSFEYRHAEMFNTDAINALGEEGFRVVANTDHSVLMERETFEIKIPGEYGHTKLALCALEINSFLHGVASIKRNPELFKEEEYNNEEEAAEKRRAARKVLFDSFPDED